MELILIAVGIAFLFWIVHWLMHQSFAAGYSTATENPAWFKVLIVRMADEHGTEYHFFSLDDDRFLAQDKDLGNGCVRVARENRTNDKVVVFIPGETVTNVKPV